MITLVDDGLGNIRAFANIYRRLNIPVAIACTASELVNAERIMLPGVGAFDWAMNRLQASGMRRAQRVPRDWAGSGRGGPAGGVASMTPSPWQARLSASGVASGVGAEVVFVLGRRKPLKRSDDWERARWA